MTDVKAFSERVKLPQGSTAVLIIPNMRPVVVLLDNETFGGLRSSSDADKISIELRMRRVPFCIIKCGGDLTQSLAELSTHFDSQEMRTWQRPVLSQ